MIQGVINNVGFLVLIMLTVAVWVGSFLVAVITQRKSYVHGAISLRKESSGKHRSRLVRALIGVPMYATVYTLIFWIVVGPIVMMLDSDDYFGFQSFVLSYEFIVNPIFLGMMFVMTSISALAIIGIFIIRKRMEHVHAEEYNKLAHSVMAIWCGVGFLILTIAVFHNSAPGGSVSGLPRGDNAVDAVMLTYLMKAAKYPKQLNGIYNTALGKLNISRETRRKLENTVASLSNMKGLAKNAVANRMLLNGFDNSTSQHVRKSFGIDRLGSLKVYEAEARKLFGRKPTVSEIQAVGATHEFTRGEA